MKMRTGWFAVAAVSSLAVAGCDDDGTSPDGPRHTLSVSVTGNGSVYTNPSGIACPPDCAENYREGRTVTLVPVPPGPDDVFTWGGACAEQLGDCQVVVNGPLDVAITFSD